MAVIIFFFLSEGDDLVQLYDIYIYVCVFSKCRVLLNIPEYTIRKCYYNLLTTHLWVKHYKCSTSDLILRDLLCNSSTVSLQVTEGERVQAAKWWPNKEDNWKHSNRRHSYIKVFLCGCFIFVCLCLLLFVFSLDLVLINVVYLLRWRINTCITNYWEDTDSTKHFIARTCCVLCY